MECEVAEFFADDIGAEVEVNPDEAEEKSKKKHKKKARLSRKEEKKALFDMLNDHAENCSDVVSSVIACVSKQNHVNIF